MLLYAICILILLVNILVGNMYHEILGVAATLLAVFIGFFQGMAFMLTWRIAKVSVYEETLYLGKHRFAGELNPAANGVVAGIILFVIIIGGMPLTDWAWLGVPSINLFVILYPINAILSIMAGIMANRIGLGNIFS